MFGNFADNRIGGELGTWLNGRTSVQYAQGRGSVLSTKKKKKSLTSWLEKNNFPS